MEATEHRQHVRLPFAVTVRLYIEECEFEGTSRDICSGGIAVTGPHLSVLESGTRCKFTIRLASGEDTRVVRGTGEVVREVGCLEDGVEGIGVRFLDLDDDSQQVLQRLIHYNAQPATPGDDPEQGTTS